MDFFDRNYLKARIHIVVSQRFIRLSYAYVNR